MSSFDRIKHPHEVQRAKRPDGREALFSPPPVEAPPVGPLQVHCSRCDRTTGLDVAEAVGLALPLVLLAPWKDHPVFARCPACSRRSWVRVTGTAP